MPGKPISDEALEKDLGYLLRGTPHFTWFEGVMPSGANLMILEPGCGSGKFGLAFAQAGHVVMLEDIDPGVLEYTRALRDRLVAHLGHDVPAAIVEKSIHTLTGRYNKVFDFVFNEGIAHHWIDERRQGCVDQMVAVTKPGGVVALQVSNALNAGMMEYAARVEHTYLDMEVMQKPFLPDELEQVLINAGLEQVTVVPVEATSFEASSIIMGSGSVGG